jgi:uncharacterized protein (TIGR00255 family)
MSLNSMTGFARDAGSLGSLSWQWEIRGVNGKALDIRVRLPAGLEHLDSEVRQRLQKALRRGNLQVNLALQDSASAERISINEPLLAQLIALAERLRVGTGSPPVRIEGMLGLRGVIEVANPTIADEHAAKRDQALLASLDRCLMALASARQEEGVRLHVVMKDQLARIAKLADAARNHPARQPEAIRARLKELVARLIDAGTGFDEVRLHQEAVLQATRSDIQEELDRLDSHVAAAGALLAAGEPAGRKLDFLAQEFNREANTLCSKANDRSLTAIGLELKAVVDQLREQIQNLE